MNDSFDPASLHHVPAELRDMPVWLLWKRVLTKDGESKKVPFYCNGDVRYGYLDTAEDRSRLVTGDVALSQFDGRKFTGLGVALGRVEASGPILSGIDCDKCLTGNELSPPVKEIIIAGAGAYTEISPSGLGIKMFGTGDIGTTRKTNGLEIYSHGRFFTVTGNRIEGDHLADLTAAAQRARELFNADADAEGQADYDTTSDEELKAAFTMGEGRYIAMLKLSSRWAPQGVAADDIEVTFLELLARHSDGVKKHRKNAKKLATSAVKKYGETRRKPRVVITLPPDDILVGIIDPNAVRLLRPHVTEGAIAVATDLVPDPVAARIVYRALRSELFLQADKVVEIVHSDIGAIITRVDEKALVGRASTGRNVIKIHVKDKRLSADQSRLPAAQAATILEDASRRAILRPIKLVLQRPVAIEHDGALVPLHPGYNDGCGVFVTGGDAIPHVSLDKAVPALLALLDEFIFASDGDKSRAVASMILPAIVLGKMARGFTPIVLNEANGSRAGKGLKAAVDAALYGEVPAWVGQKRGGVGSLDEQIADYMLKGKPFICLDNLRDELNSPFLEMILTAKHGYTTVRVPFHGNTHVDPSLFNFQMTSNGVTLTQDQANRTLVVRILKQPEEHEFTRKPFELLEHIKSNQTFYSGCVFAVVRCWFDAGKPRNNVAHSFEEMGTLDWIVRQVFKLEPLLDEHKEIVMRLSSPEDSFMRGVVAEMEKQERLRRDVLASALVDLARGAGLVPTGGWPIDRDEANKHMGKILAQVFKKGEVRDFGHLRIRRSKGTYDSKPAKWYCVWRPADGPPPDFVDEGAPL